MGLVPIGRQSQPACDRNAFPITTRVYPRRVMIRSWRAEWELTPIAKPLGRATRTERKRATRSERATRSSYFLPSIFLPLIPPRQSESKQKARTGIAYTSILFASIIARGRSTMHVLV